MYRISKDTKFNEWLDTQTARTKLQILKRLSKIEQHGHFGDHKSVSDYETGYLKNAVGSCDGMMENAFITPISQRREFYCF